MATEPKNIKEVNLTINGVNQKFDLLKTLVGWVLGVLVAIVGGGAAILVQVSGLRTDIAVLQTKVDNLKEQQSATQESVRSVQESIRSLEAKSVASLSRIENKLEATAQQPQRPTETPLHLSEEEVRFLRIALKVGSTGKPTQAKIGDLVGPKDRLQFLSASVTDKVPQLKGYRYDFDPSGAALIISDRTSRVVEIIEAA